MEYLLPRHHKPLYSSAYFSRHKTQPLVPHVNLAVPGALDAVFSARAFKGEIIISCFKEDPFSLRWQHHYVRMLQAKGFDHVVPIGWSEASCAAFRDSWCAGAACNATSAAGAAADAAAGAGGDDDDGPQYHLYPGCAYLDAEAFPGADDRWRDARRVDAIVYLWMVRYYVATEALRRGINVLMSDTDVMVNSGAGPAAAAL